MEGGRRLTSTHSWVSLVHSTHSCLLLRRRGPDPLGGLGPSPLCLDGRDLYGPDHLDAQDLEGPDLNVHLPFVAGRNLHLYVMGRGETLSLATSSFFSSSSRRAWLFAGLTRGEASFAASLKPPSLDDYSAFLLALLSDALLHQRQGCSEELQKAKIMKELDQDLETYPPLRRSENLSFSGAAD